MFLKKFTERNHPFRRGGLETLIAVIVLIVLVVGGLVYVASYYGGVAGGASQQVSIQLQGSQIKVNAADGSGSVYLKIYNQGPGGVRLLNINITDKTGKIYSIAFNVNNIVDVYSGSTKIGSSGSGWNVVSTLSGSQGTGTALLSGSVYYLSIPAGATLTILITHNTVADIRSYFDPAATYRMVLTLVQAPQIETTIPTVSFP
jgi:hypothetical protein